MYIRGWGDVKIGGSPYKPTYYGEAVIEPEIIEAKGLELPTRVYANAAEAVNLKAFSEEIQPFVKEIFIDKYPRGIPAFIRCWQSISNSRIYPTILEGWNIT